MTYSQACELALQYSIINPHWAYFVNWIEDAEYIVETEPEHNGQYFYFQGEICIVDEFEWEPEIDWGQQP